MSMHRVWIMNISPQRYADLCTRGALLDYVFAKGYMSQFYDTTRVETGLPMGTEVYEADELHMRGLQGVYGWRRELEV